MPEIMAHRAISPIEIMRAVSSNFDNNMIVVGTEDATAISDSVSLATLGKKARLLNTFQFMFTAATPSSSDQLEQENMQLRSENLVLRDAIRRIEDRLTGIEAVLPSEKVIVLREISKEEAKKEIRDLFAKGQTLYYSDIADRLRLDLQVVVEICNELQNNGEIEVVDDTLRSR